MGSTIMQLPALADTPEVGYILQRLRHCCVHQLLLMSHLGGWLRCDRQTFAHISYLMQCKGYGRVADIVVSNKNRRVKI